MSTALPVEIVVTEGPDGSVAYDFPRRELGAWRWLSIIPIGGGMAAIGFISAWTFGFAGGLIKIFGPWGGLAGLAALPFLFGALSLIGVGLAMVIGRARLMLTDTHLIIIEQVGWFPWRRRLARNRMARLIVHASRNLSHSGITESTPLTNQFAALMAELPTGKPQVILLGYPRDWLISIANELSARLAIDAAIPELQTVAVPVTVVDDISTDSGNLDRLEQPADSPIEFQLLGEGCVFTIPARGVWKGSGGLFGFSLVWCGFMTVFTTFAVFGFANGKPNNDDALWVFPMVITLFWTVGIGILLASINMGRRQAAVAVANGRMKTIVSGLFGVSRKEWELTDLQTVRKGPSGMAVNDVPVMQLHIVPREGTPYGLLTGRDDAELEWMATHLRRQIRGETAAMTDAGE